MELIRVEKNKDDGTVRSWIAEAIETLNEERKNDCRRT